MPAKQQLLRPVSGRFIFFTLLLGLLFNLLPWEGIGLMLRPNLLALIIIHWCIHQPRMFGMGAAWFMGLMLDVADGMLMGQNALAFTLLAFAALLLRRRVLMFPLAQQALHIMPMLLFLQVVVLIIKVAAGGSFADWGYFSATISGTLLWPVVSSLLLITQRREPRSEPPLSQTTTSKSVK